MVRVVIVIGRDIQATVKIYYKDKVAGASVFVAVQASVR